MFGLQGFYIEHNLSPAVRVEDEVVKSDSAMVVKLRRGLNDESKRFSLREHSREHLGFLPHVRGVQLSLVHVKHLH